MSFTCETLYFQSILPFSVHKLRAFHSGDIQPHIVLIVVEDFVRRLHVEFNMNTKESYKHFLVGNTCK